jgi:UDP-glucose 4-epimerase
MVDVSVVVHLAARLHIPTPDSDHEAEATRVNYTGTQNVVEAALQHRAERLVHFSSIAVYGAGEGSVFSEESDVRPGSAYAQTKLAAEQLVLDAKKSDGRPLGTVLRLAAVYGSRVKGNYQQLLHALARGWFIPVGDGKNMRSLVYDRDVAHAALLAATHPAAAGRIYNVANKRPCELRELIAVMCQALGRKPPRIALPPGATRSAFGLVEDVARILAVKPPVTRAMIDKYVENVAVDSGRIRTELGFESTYDLTAGWTETLRELRSARNFSHASAPSSRQILESPQRRHR